MTWLLAALVFAWGLAIGSFINVCVYRLPRGKSVVMPRSFCPGCGVPIKWHDNIPLLSFILLRARCRNCRAPISWRYPAAELLTALLFLWVHFHIFGGRQQLFLVPFYWYFCASLVALSAIDLEHYIIPDRITYPLAAVGLFLAGLHPVRLGQGTIGGGLFRALLGLAVGGAALFLVRILGRAAFKKEAMGMGDVKLMAAVGAWQGWAPTLLAVFLGAVVAAVVGVALVAAKKARWQSNLPFGPYLALGSLVTLLYGSELLHWYLNFFRI